MAKARTGKLGSYHLEELIGRGGMGQVWRAEHALLKRPAAIKVIRPEVLGAEEAHRLRLIERFEREARATSALTSPHTVQVYDFGRTDDGGFYYAMELLEGYTLQALVDEEGPVAPARAIHILQQVCESLGEAHARGLVHRDVKPGNIFLCKRGLIYDFVKVLDFGLVKELGDDPDLAQLTGENMIPGTPAFMPPEAVSESADHDARSDLYSLGCVMYWLLCGELVFDVEGAIKLILAHLHDVPEPPSSRTETEVPAALDALVLRLLSKRPEDRPADARALSKELAACGVSPRWTNEDAEEWWRVHRGESKERISLASPTPAGTEAQASGTRRRQRSVLVVDDEPAVGLVLASLLKQASYDAEHVLSGQAALEVLADRPIDLVLTDMRMPGMTGLELLAEVTRRIPGLPIIMLTAHGSVELAVNAMKVGACDFMLKPFDRDAVLFAVDKALRAAEASANRPPEPAVRSIPPTMTGSAAMARCAELIGRAARTSAPVLVRGERGVGKEVAARAIHAASERSASVFIAVTCASLPSDLLESELFGYVTGAFEGASMDKPGRIELATGGTLFLNEVGAISPAVQMRILRLLQTGEHERIGARTSRSSDVRVIASTARDLERMVAAGELREDLFYRLDVLNIWVPALRDRPEDVPRLAVELCELHAIANGREGMHLDEEALALLAMQTWPGNVRELRNFVERLVVFADSSPITAAGIREELEHRSRRSAHQVLERTDGDRAKAARLLDMNRYQLHTELVGQDVTTRDVSRR